MAPEDLIRIRHILDAVKEALTFSRDKSRDDLDNSQMLTLAIIKELEIIGEAASKFHPRLRPVSLISHGSILSVCATA